MTVFVRPAPTFRRLSKRAAGEGHSFGFLFNCVGRCHQCFKRVVLKTLINYILRLVFPFLARTVMSVNVARRGLKVVCLVLLKRLVLAVDHADISFVHQ